MKTKDYLRNPVSIALLSAFTLGIFANLYTLYLMIRMRTFTSVFFRIMAGVLVILFVARFYEFGLLVFFMINWFTIPHRLEEKREFANIPSEIDWKIGLIPTIPVFYTIGFLLFKAPNSELSYYTIVRIFGNFIRLTPRFELSDGSAYAIGIPLIVSFIIALSWWVWIVTKKYIEYMDKRDEKMEEWVEDREIRKKQRNLLENIKPDKLEDLPMLELDDFSSINQNNDGIGQENGIEFDLDFDDDLDFQ